MTGPVALLRELVATPSINPYTGACDDTHGETRMVAFLTDWLQARGIDHELQEVLPGRQNVIARLRGGDAPSLVFEAHMDTVEISGMEIAPFDPVVRDGKLYGRGACDCKAAMAGMLTALEQTAQRGTPPGEVTFAATIDEEYRFRGVKHLVDHGFRADGAVVGEPTGLQLVIAHKGALRAQVVTHGRAAHSSEPHKGESAIYHMARVLAAIEEYAAELATRPQHSLVFGPTVSVGEIHGGQAANIVADRCEISVDRRVTPLEDPDQVEAELRQWLSDRLTGMTWEMNVLLADGGLDGTPDSAIATRVAAAMRKVTGGCAIGGVQYGTDGSKFAASGTPAVVFGPGSIAQAHTAVEWVEVEQVELAARVYAEIMWG